MASLSYIFSCSLFAMESVYQNANNGCIWIWFSFFFFFILFDAFISSSACWFKVNVIYGLHCLCIDSISFARCMSMEENYFSLNMVCQVWDQVNWFQYKKLISTLNIRLQCSFFHFIVSFFNVRFNSWIQRWLMSFSSISPTAEAYPSIFAYKPSLTFCSR